MQRVVVLGNSGSGLAAALARRDGRVHLDLDTVAWLGTSPPSRRPLADSARRIDASLAPLDTWVVEGCYADLIAHLLRCTRLVFLNPGVETCVAHCRARPWEPHKYSSPAAQERNLAMLLQWVRDYETRSDEFSLAAHRRLFHGFGGAKVEYTTLPA